MQPVFLTRRRLSNHERRRIETLQRRADMLDRRIDEMIDAGNERGTGWSRAELGALRWAIRNLDDAGDSALRSDLDSALGIQGGATDDKENA